MRIPTYRPWDRTTDSLLNAAHFSDVIFDPKFTHSGEPNESAFNIAHNTDLPYFEWLSKPEQAYKSKRFVTGMHAGNRLGGHGIIIKGALCFGPSLV